MPGLGLCDTCFDGRSMADTSSNVSQIILVTCLMFGWACVVGTVDPVPVLLSTSSNIGRHPLRLIVCVACVPTDVNVPSRSALGGRLALMSDIDRLPKLGH